MTTAAGTQLRRPSAVRVLTPLLATTAVAGVVVELLNFRYAPEPGYTLGVRTGWAVLRSLGFLVLIWHVRRGRAAARPFGLILTITTIFAVGRLVVPREGTPPLPGVIGFAILTALCAAVLWLLYRSPAVRGYLVRHPRQLIFDRTGLSWQERVPRRPPVTGWLLTARVAAFTYSPLMLVPCLVAVGQVFDGRIDAVPLLGAWFVAGLATSYLVLFCTFFLLRGRPWAARLLVGVTFVVLLVDLPLCWVLLGPDGLVRDGGPLVVAAAITCYGLWRGRRAVVGAPDARDAAVGGRVG
ncbi:hypothetical protein [Plantactinospora sp. GCM10030261]|uniref:hypothetical protein n=1 Tax=Plantactinospora sp. GCM10030261 TaxID=3273420 RepID=UPI0036167454